jgi:tetratricopeptide (TPR) repeat protein
LYRNFIIKKETMRKLVLALLLAASFTGLYAQKLDDVKEKIGKQKWDEAKEKIDKAMQDPKAQTNSEAWFYKAQVYHNLAKAHPEDASLEATSFDAMKNYLKLEEKQPENKRYLLSTLEGNKTVFDYYSESFKAGADAFNKKDYEKALKNFQTTLNAFDLLKEYKFTTATFDTTSVLYAGVSAEQLKNKEQAVKYYSMLVDKKIPDTTYQGVYEYVVNYYTLAKDYPNAKKYLAIGEEVFPKYDRWLAYELEMAGDEKTQKIAKYRELVQRYPTNSDIALDYGVLYFNYTYSNENKPADYASRQDTLGHILQNALAVEQTTLGNYLMSRHVNNQIADLEEQKRAVKGATPADVAKKKDFDTKISQKNDELIVYSQKAADLYAKQPELKGVDKIYYKEVLRDLADYYQLKKDTAKAAEYQNKIKQLQ